MAKPARLTVTLRELAWLIHRRAPARANGGPIPTSEIAILKQVVDAPGSTVGELAQALGLRQPNASAALRALLQYGWVSRVGSPEDRRVARIYPTADGIQEHFEIAGAWAESLETAIQELSPAHRAALEGAQEALAALGSVMRSNGLARRDSA